MATIPQMPQEGTPGAVHTLNDLLKYYEREYFPTKSLVTQYQLRRMYVWLRTELGWKPLTDFTPEFLRTWRDALSQRHSPGTVRRYFSILAAPFQIAAQELEWLPSNPFRKVRKPSEPAGRVRFLSDEERPRLLAACQFSRNPHLYPIVLLALSTGARKSQLRELRWKDLDFERGLVRLGASKRAHPRNLPLRGPVVELLHRLRADAPALPDGWVFARFDRRKPVLVDDAFRVACKRARVLDFRFHDLRHTAASFLAMSGGSLRDIQEVLGHTTSSMSAKYIHLTEGHTADVLDRMLKKMFPDSPPPPEGDPHGPV